ncbi:MAG: cytochrome c3 family protein [Deltaproteobacteria bacterium]|nr:cytochrome c3 family protein [Deltaproteobacteria bacterium]
MKKLIVYALTGVISLAIGYWVQQQFFSDRAPVQPINFSHKIHAGVNKIPCQYCHIYAERSRVSGVPNVQRCMGCHKIIKTDSPEIQKVTAYWEKKEPIPWTKVHNLPDYVYFPHKRHVRAGVECTNCHGDVPNMDRITKVSSLQMGWCLTCHTQRNVKNGRDCWTCHK